jgi:predicted ATPase
MDSLVGRNLSHFRVEERIGSGGMGVVYRARDTQLGRDVAIKVLPEEFSKDATRIARFRREAKVLASLNHPSIAAIYGLERSRWSREFLVLELVDGASLAERLRGGPLTIEETLRVCGEIARALEAAHERGVVHRDVKPGNVMLTARGAAKVLDFGLARHTPGGDGPSSSTTLTESGAIMGTPGYMSPEQIQAGRQDCRVDVFGFGCILYECLTGQRAFPGASVQDRLSAAVSREPDWSALPVGTPQRLRRLLAACLERDPRRRLAEIAGARREIEDLARPGPGISESRAESGGAPPHNIPEPLTSFVGRDAEIRGCLEALRHCRLLTLTGSAGCGKTRLALKLTETLRGVFPDGAWLVDLSALSDPSRVPISLASALAIHEGAAEPLLANIVHRLAGKRLLLLLDNCEHLLATCSHVARELLEGCPEIVILATSREPLHLPGEQTYQVPTMAVPDPDLNSRQIESVESVRLFMERARALVPQFRPSGKAAAAVAEICRRLDGIPLAIELAAARVKLLAPEEILDLLGDRFRLLIGGSDAGLPRHHTLAAAIDWSHGQLDESERRMFRSLAVFSGGWRLDAATAICGGGADRIETLGIMTRLVDKSLVLPEQSLTSTSRCRYLETVRQYALDRLRVAGEEEAARGSHLAYFVDLAERAALELTGPGQTEWLSRLAAENENLLAALDYCSVSPARDEVALRLSVSLWRFWLAHGHFVLGRRLLDQALRRPGALAPSRTRAEALIGAGALAFHQNDWEIGRAHFEESLRISRAIGNPDGIGHALIGLANLSLGQGDYQAAGPLYREAMEVFEGTGHRRGVGLAVSNLGRATELMGDLDSAFPLYEQGIQVFRELGDVASMALRLSSLGDLALKLGRRDSARDYLVESLNLIRDLKERRAGAYALSRSAALAVEEKRLREAAVLYGASDALRRRIGPIMTPQETSEHEARVARARREYGERQFAAAWQEGERLSFADAIAFALESLQTRSTDTLGPGPLSATGSP